VCAWCGNPISVRPTGRLPKWCSASCRHRAWEQRRALTSDRRPLEVVDRVVRVEVEKPVRVVERVTVEAMPNGRGWVEHLHMLVTQLQAGRVYDRDLLEHARVLDVVSQAIGASGMEAAPSTRCPCGARDEQLPPPRTRVARLPARVGPR
jgi:hypothetical protein